MIDFFLSLPAETYTSWMVILLLTIFSLIVFVKAKKVDPLAKPKGIMLIAEWVVSTIQTLLSRNMGKTSAI